MNFDILKILEKAEFDILVKEALYNDFLKAINGGKKDEIYSLVERFSKGAISYDDVTDSLKTIFLSFSINEYTACLLTLSLLLIVLEKTYIDKKLPLSVYIDVARDLKYKALDCEGRFGVWGINGFNWFKEYFEFKKFPFGKLQYQLGHFYGDTVVDGVEIKDGDNVLYVHVPRTGGKLDYDSVRNSYAMVDSFIKKYFPDYFGGKPTILVFRSWMLFDKWKEVLPASGNFMRFCADYKIVGRADYEDYSTAWRIFYKPYENNPEEMPQDTTLQRACLDLIKKGEKLGFAKGVYILK